MTDQQLEQQSDPVNPAIDLDQSVRSLARERQILAERKSELGELVTEFEARQVIQQLRQQIAFYEEAVRDNAEQIHLAAILEYNQTGAKTIHPAVHIRVERKPMYDPQAAWEFAVRTNTSLLVLDTKKFEKFAKALTDANMGLEFVTFSNLPKVTIASDLSEWLQGE